MLVVLNEQVLLCSFMCDISLLAEPGCDDDDEEESGHDPGDGHSHRRISQLAGRDGVGCTAGTN